MALIFGWGGGNFKDKGEAVYMTCPRCNNDVFYRLTNAKKWFRLYFVPVVPYSSKWFLICPICSHGRAVPHAEVEITRQLVEVVGQIGRGQRDVEDYAIALG